LGDVMIDVVVRPSGDWAPTSDTPSKIRILRGGSGANLAIALGASGHEVLYVGAGGSDSACEMFADELRRSGVTPRLQVVDAPTGTVVSLVASDGRRLFLTDRGANSRLDGAFVVEQLHLPFDHLHVSGYLLLDPATRSVGVEALSLARERGSTTSVDVCSAAPLREVTAETFLVAAAHAKQLFANEEEALILSTQNDAESALDVLAGLFGEVVITTGAQGALGALGAERFHVLARSVEVLDTTGAGDAATGAYLGARLRGEAPLAALESAMIASARVLGGLGALG
jgi:sugar/nucleoside kinase (ribokinase family)